MDEGENEEGDNISGRGNNTCKVPGQRARNKEGTGSGLVEGEAGLQREWEEDRDRATSEFYPEGDREPLQGFKDENDQLHVLGGSLAAVWVWCWWGQA